MLFQELFETPSDVATQNHFKVCVENAALVSVELNQGGEWITLKCQAQRGFPMWSECPLVVRPGHQEPAESDAF